MKSFSWRKLLSAGLCMVLIAALALTFTACTADQADESSAPAATTTATVTTTAPAVTTLGQGKTSFQFDVVDMDGKKTSFAICTDKETVGAALLELKLIAGEDSQYGLYVKSVNGITADFDKDQTFWAFYVNGKMAEKGVDSTPVQAGAVYEMRVQK